MANKQSTADHLLTTFSERSPMTEAEKERAAVVAWLRKRARRWLAMETYGSYIAQKVVIKNCEMLGGYADIIERGDLLKGTGDE